MGGLAISPPNRVGQQGTLKWRLIEPGLPPACKIGRPRAWSMREILNAIFYVLRGGIVWRLLPSDFPPWATVYRWFAAFRDGSVFEKRQASRQGFEATIHSAAAFLYAASVILLQRRQARAS